MFREIARQKQAMSHEACLQLLRTQLRGVLSVLGDDGYPYGMPLNHFYREEDGCLYFHTGRTGHRMDAIRQCNKASFCVIDEGRRIGQAWPLHFESVIVFGHIEMIEDQETIYGIARELSLRFTDDEEYIAREIAVSGPRTAMFRLVPEHMTGKRVTEA
ncbi:MAG: pyridoxamine 5'-phosphate oxidase family protein [Clostridia bacterium]|nr:pyridoxamine 5'-phosphate oxidase family protein [Clostridia bacterium]